MIVGTAGHIDHGKTTLVRALTGVDTDRLPGERARGISIELGYAYLDIPRGLEGSGATGEATSVGPEEPHSAAAVGRIGLLAPAVQRIGFVDVPGHERLVRTMLAGATGIDFGLLVIAADDGPMPQTREHLAVLSLLGVRRGAVVLTKADRVDAARLAAAYAEAAVLLRGTSLEDAPRLAVSAPSGAGLGALKALLFDAAASAASADPAIAAASRAPAPAASTASTTPSASAEAAENRLGFRLAVDRSFTLPGIGTVVTGTVHAGRVRVGDELVVAPARGTARRARVRGLRAADRAVGEAGAGERCALALAGLDRDEIGRGDWVVEASIALETTRLDAHLQVWRDEPRVLRSGMTVHLHHGTADVLATVAVLTLDADPVAEVDPNMAEAIPPGRWGTVQLVLREPVAAWHGDRLVLRDAAASRTLAGGRVLDPYAPARARRQPDRLRELTAWRAPTPADRLRQLIAAAAHGVSTVQWARAEGRWPDAAAAGWQLSSAASARMLARAIDVLRDCHDRHPTLPGLDAAALRRAAAPRLADPAWRALLTDWRAAGRIGWQGSFAVLPDRVEALSAGDTNCLAEVAGPIAAAPEGAWVRDLASQLDRDEALLRASLARLASRGALHQIVKDLYWTPAAITGHARQVRSLADAGDGAVTVATFRDAAGLGRKRATQLLEYFDRIGVTRRLGDRHLVRAGSALFEASEAGARPV